MLINGNLGHSIPEGEEMDRTKMPTTISSRRPLPMSFVTRTEARHGRVKQACMLLQHLEVLPRCSHSFCTKPPITDNNTRSCKEFPLAIVMKEMQCCNTKLYSSSCWFHQFIADAWRLDVCVFVVQKFCP